MTVGEKIKNARIAKGLTQEELGKILGTTKSAVSKWEKGTVQNMKRSMMVKVASALDLNAHDLVSDGEIELPEGISDIKREFILAAMDLPDEKLKALIQMIKAFRED